MPRLDWHDVFNINVAKIDEQHRKQLEMAQSVHDALHEGDRPDELLNKLDELLQFTRMHFAYEETLMAEHGYPGTEDHRREHTVLLNRVEKLREALASGRTLMYTTDLDVSDDWVLAHIDDADRQLGRFLNELQIF